MTMAKPERLATMAFCFICIPLLFSLLFVQLPNGIYCIERLEMKGRLSFEPRTIPVAIEQFFFLCSSSADIYERNCHTHAHTYKCLGTEQYRGDFEICLFLFFFFVCGYFVSTPGSMRRSPASIHTDNIQHKIRFLLIAFGLDSTFVVAVVWRTSKAQIPQCTAGAGGGGY